MSGLGLAHTRDIVLLTLNGHQGRMFDQGAIHRLIPIGNQAPWQLVLQEYLLDGIQIKLRWQIHDRQVFVIKLAVGFGVITIAFDQITKEAEVLADMAVHIHAHKAGQLDKAGVNLLAFTRETLRYRADHIILEPLIILTGSIVVYFSRIHAGIDRAAHQNQGLRGTRIVLCRHHCSGHNGGNARLTDRNDMSIRP